MAVQFDHTIVGCHDNRETAEFWADVLGLDIGRESGPFIPIPLAHGAVFDFARVPPHISEIQPQHYAFLVSEAEFDAAYAKIQRYKLDHWADPQQHGVNEINHHDGGRGVYFLDPNGHFLELITVPYGGWPA
ncbi:VOC family protein [Nocardia mangyaensis]|uniref:VOC family protein n=1 Tax=Nocardia mangyaensis TaxID=2213200 RepID=UPI002676EE8F|nr:VOC family protein [Nocardia mangyaensis]MDO3649106.1 VOC family protein [Nocardia mangyaensis]